MKTRDTVFRLVLEVFEVADPAFPNTLRFGYCWRRFNENVLHRFSWIQSYASPIEAMRAAVGEWKQEWTENEVQKVEAWPVGAAR